MSQESGNKRSSAEMEENQAKKHKVTVAEVINSVKKINTFPPDINISRPLPPIKEHESVSIIINSDKDVYFSAVKPKPLSDTERVFCEWNRRQYDDNFISMMQTLFLNSLILRSHTLNLNSRVEFIINIKNNVEKAFAKHEKKCKDKPDFTAEEFTQMFYNIAEESADWFLVEDKQEINQYAMQPGALCMYMDKSDIN